MFVYYAMRQDLCSPFDNLTEDLQKVFKKYAFSFMNLIFPPKKLVN